ncbi:type II toxin-antitoxin system VapC family toxin [Argonema antarcticum]|uniref:type II toxin-antitoxin system VapC family toxin n=1 Tax=Argonema antarcticum TaxID=2942763 RepID=UPI0020114603|nr:PIN domain-containing protein [Argonema antarcticum]MCL1474163.1 PIN domain-containing protein [Argonema antarcticum A004/B2]
MATEPKKIYLDTNVIAYVVNTKAPQHRAALEIFRPSETELLCLSSQVLAEFYSYITNPAILATPIEPTEAISRIKRICQMPHICLLSTPLDLFERWLILLEERPVTNGGIFDLLHIAIMLAHRVTSIYTFNVKDFSWCSQIEVIDPSHI